MYFSHNKLMAVWLAVVIVFPGTTTASADGFRPVTEVFSVSPRTGPNAQTLPSTCWHAGTGLRLGCAPEWTARVEEETVRLRISTDPSVELLLAYRRHKRPAGIRFGWAELRALDRYQGWFDMSQRHECGRKLVQTMGYVNGTPRGRAFDYYLADWEGIYSVQFTVSRAVQFEDYRPLFEEIIDSVEFVADNRDTVNFRAPNARQCQTITRE
ncbi:MAG: hypothetical protein KC900_10935 [Candidatus Omnitrophica bacterium]|nr:hypothetical protein [Candidatus Omnitrophota bacterium]